MKTLASPWSLLYGLYFYLLVQLIFALRFSRFNTTFAWSDLLFGLVGVGSIQLLRYFSGKLAAKQKLLLIPFMLALPFGYLGAIGGGLLGPIGLLAFGLTPFALFLSLGYWLIKRFSRPAAKNHSASVA